MCQECGCGVGGNEVRVGAHEHVHEGVHSHGHDHDASGGHGPVAGVGSGSGGRLVELNRSLLEKNNQLADRNRARFRECGLLVLNVVSAPGSGKTTLIRETALRLAGRLRVGVIVGDLATDNDAVRLRTAGVPVVQITTGTVCHLDADMVARAAAELDLGAIDLLVIENVGNLVCPADYDLGEAMRVVLLSTTEGEDKPLKYPPLFHSANAVVVTKADLGAATGYDRNQALGNLKRVSHHATIFEVSARTGEGMEAWVEYLVRRSGKRSG